MPNKLLSLEEKIISTSLFMSTTLTNPLLYSTKFSATNSLIIRLTLLIFEPTPSTSMSLWTVSKLCSSKNLHKKKRRLYFKE